MIGALRGRVFYGWWIVLVGSVINAVGGGVFFHGFTVFFLPLKAEFRTGSAAIAVREALRTRAFWALMGAISLRLFVTTALATHFVPILVWAGMGEAAAAYLVGLSAFGSIPTTWCCWQPPLSSPCSAFPPGCGDSPRPEPRRAVAPGSPRSARE